MTRFLFSRNYKMFDYCDLYVKSFLKKRLHKYFQKVAMFNIYKFYVGTIVYAFPLEFIFTSHMEYGGFELFRNF